VGHFTAFVFPIISHRVVEQVKRTEGHIRNKRTGEEFRVAKGAPHVIVELDGDEDIHHSVMEKVSALADDGIRSLAVAKTDAQGNWHFMGILTFLVRLVWGHRFFFSSSFFPEITWLGVPIEKTQTNTTGFVKTILVLHCFAILVFHSLCALHVTRMRTNLHD
jgi:hypothetical protein